MTNRTWIPDAGDLVWTAAAPSGQREPPGRRPALVVSSRIFTAMTGLAVVCPIAIRGRPLPSSVELPSGLPVAGEVLTSNIRSIDTLVWPIIYAGAAVAPSIADEVRAKLAAFITI